MVAIANKIRLKKPQRFNSTLSLLCSTEGAYFLRDSRMEDVKHKRINYNAEIKKAIQEGKLVKPEQCSQCNRRNIRINAHHEDYTKPLDVIWLCCRCHVLLHHNIPFNDFDFEIERIMIKGVYYYIPRLKQEPCQLCGLLTEGNIVDNHEYFRNYCEWDELLKILTQREQEVIKLRYGLNGGGGHTYREVGRILGVSFSCVHSIETNAIQKLRRCKGLS